MENNCRYIIQQYIDYLSSEFFCEEQNNYLKITTPFQYSDGDCIEIFIESHDNSLRFSDLGETLRKLSTIDFNFKTKHIRSIFSEILTSNSISSFQGDLSFTSELNEDFGDKLNNLLRAIQQTENLCFTQKEKSTFDFRSDVEHFLIEKKFSPILNMQITGASGNTWQINFFINHNSNIMIKALSSPLKAGEKEIVTRAYAAYSDIKKKFPEYKRSLILDDHIATWDVENINLAGQVVDIPMGYWSQREAYAQSLATNIVKE